MAMKDEKVPKPAGPKFFARFFSKKRFFFDCLFHLTHISRLWNKTNKKLVSATLSFGVDAQLTAILS